MRSLRDTILIAAGLVFVASTASGDEGDPTFHLRESETHLGSNIKRENVRSGSVPLNKSYDEMTAEQRAVIRGWYESLGDRDEPPFPRDGLAPIYRQIAKAQQKVLVTASLAADVEVDPKGVVSSVSIVRSTGMPDFDRYVAALLMNADYKPALCDGVPCRMSLPFRIDFTTGL